MSETSSPSVQIHPISPSSSLASTDSGPHSELTSDEEPDLGAFTTVLREWTHLQPPPRIPVQIRTATSSTTPTFQPSIMGSEILSNHSRNSRITGHSAVSSFTRPPSSSAHPEGSTVWAHAPIASYLYSGTPSNDDEEEESYESLGTEGEYTPYSMASTGLTVEIASETDFDQSNGRGVASSPYLYPSDSGISLPLTLESDNNRLDSRENAHQEEELETSDTSRGRPFPANSLRTLSQADSLITSIQLQSQNRPTPTEDTLAETMAVPSAAPLSTYVSESPPTFSPNRSRNPEPPRTTSDSSFTTSDSASSSSLSLVSYQISETVSIPNSEELPSADAPSSSAASVSTSIALKTQRSVPTSNSGSTTSFGTQRPLQPLQHSFPIVPISQSSSFSSTGSPLPNPHSPLPQPEPELSALINNTRRNFWRQDTVVNDMGTPDQPPSETLLFDPPRNRKPEFLPVVNDDDDDIKVERHAISGHLERAQAAAVPAPGYTSAYERPGPSSQTYGRTFPQPPENVHRQDRRELYNEDEDELEEEHYPASYPHSHGLPPRLIGPALTPRGIPPAPVSLRPQPEAQTMTTNTANSVVQPLGYPNQSLFQNTQSANLPQQRPQQHLTGQLQHTFQTNQSNPNMYTTAPVILTESQSTNHPQFSTSNVYTPRALPPAQSSVSYIPQPYAYSSSSSQYSVPERQTTPELARNNTHGYPYSLLGLHALPASFASRGTSTLPSASSFDSDTATNASQIQLRADFSDDNSTISTDAAEDQIDTESIVLEQAVPSLGVLDGVLSFIAVERERARNNAVREGATSTSTTEADNTRDVGSGEEGEGIEHEGLGEALEGEEDWKHVVGHEQDQPRRKRRRKRPPRAHASAIATSQIPNPPGGTEIQDKASSVKGVHVVVDHTVSAPSTVTSSPKRKKKTKSVTPSISTSASVISLAAKGEGLKTPTKARSKEKEFLIPPPSLSRSTSKSKDKDTGVVKILRRPDRSGSDDDDDDDSNFDGGRTPTNFDNMEGEKSLVTIVPPINLLGKKGKRVGRREREKEKLKRDDLGPEPDAKDEESRETVEDNSFGDAYENDDNDEGDGDGIEPQEDEDDRAEDNDSLSNLSLLQPPRRRRDRSRRRKARDTTHIHTIAGITGAYQSTPGTPGHLKESDEPQNADFGHEQVVKGNIEENDVFESSINDISSTPEKRKRTRTKRVKPAQSVTDLRLGHETAEASSSPATHPQGEDTANIAAIKPKKGRTRAAELLGHEDILEMDRNQLQNYLITAGSGLVLMNSRPDKNQPPPDSKRGRLITLARQLRHLFPEQREDLGRVISRLEKQGNQGCKMKKIKSGEVNDEIEAAATPSKPISIPGSKRKRTRKGHGRVGSEGATTGGEGFDPDDDQVDDENNAGVGFDNPAETEEEEEEIDPRGRPPRRGDVLVHVFIDHSNILIGLLSHLKRNQSFRKNKTRGRPLPAIISRAIATTKTSNQNDAASSAFAAVKSRSSRPLPIPSKNSNANAPSTEENSVSVQLTIPLPSFATMSRSLPTTSALSSHMETKENGGLSDDGTTPPERETNSDGYEYPNADNEEAGGMDDSLFAGSMKEKKYPKHLWHAALALILERGRPVTRRVVVTSSPLYQPMDAIERLGYELRVFIRVPDFGDGQDRERHKDKDKNSSSKTNGGTKSTQSSPAYAASSSGLPTTSQKSKSIGHVRHLSGNTSTESGSGGGGGSTNTPGAGGFHSYYGTPNNGTPQAKVKFREQGVDELLQLKLHQALAATDDVPEGSTIVLATGDGNVGQFNEDGFLGPVRTALRRGWRVELYAWEDGLSRAWKREFGDGSEWGRSGLFRVIGMEQFATGLVEAIL